MYIRFFVLFCRSALWCPPLPSPLSGLLEVGLVFALLCVALRALHCAMGRLIDGDGWFVVVGGCFVRYITSIFLPCLLLSSLFSFCGGGFFIRLLPFSMAKHLYRGCGQERERSNRREKDNFLYLFDATACFLLLSAWHLLGPGGNGDGEDRDKQHRMPLGNEKNEVSI